MKALTLWQPWASAVAVGAKRIETRSWSTEYRGPLAIHAAQTLRGIHELQANSRGVGGVIMPPSWRAALTPAFPWISDDRPPWIEDLNELPRGCMVAIAELVDVVPLDDPAVQDLADAVRRHFADLDAGHWCENDLGNFIGPDRYAWLLDNVQRLVPHIPAVGRQGLWSWPAPGAVAELHARRRGVLS